MSVSGAALSGSTWCMPCLPTHIIASTVAVLICRLMTDCFVMSHADLGDYCAANCTVCEPFLGVVKHRLLAAVNCELFRLATLSQLVDD